MQLSPLDAELVALSRDHLLPLVLGLARIGACLVWVPYLAPGVMPAKMTRTVVAVMVLIGLWPSTVGTATGMPQDMLSMGGVLLREVLIGTAIGIVVALPFHIFHGMGAIVDNQRGAGVGAMLDPVSGMEATELANLLQLMSVVVFMATGGMIVLLEVIQDSYTLVPMGGAISLNLDNIQGFASTLLAGAVRMALPVLLLLFLVEILLGTLSRFAQQLNPFSISLAIKSLIAFIALFLYLMPTIARQVPLIRDSTDALKLLLGATP
ncbi:type III secretion system export apparatus subunit SctT [Stenotrophomonas sp. PS02289]|uniref:type III secretion system export apparatus subunit SctT n=1 Tax=Stenotrophomonas sp. PS02289 TaxID=2991422 RepID=UPI00249B7127|nr:type III secretion system export apparatus subunit SctT [Stenotrophomonas sp. PS02289]